MFTLDTKAAKAGSGGSSRIDTTAKYKGTIKFAKYFQSQTNSKFVTIMFRSDDGQEARIQICTHGKAGQTTYGYKQIQAIMACLKTKTLTLGDETHDDYNHEAKEVQPTKLQVFKEMTGAKIGLALYRHDQTGTNGDYYSMEIAAPFNYESEMTASEILDRKTTPEQLGKIVINMKDKDSRTQGGPAASDPYSAYAATTAMQMPDDLNSDIPF